MKTAKQIKINNRTRTVIECSLCGATTRIKGRIDTKRSKAAIESSCGSCSRSQPIRTSEDWCHDKGDGSFMYVSQENAASGQVSASEVVDGWMNSPGHRAAIMAPQAEQIGVGFEVDDRNGDTYWIQTFGIPWSEGDRLYFS